MLHDFPTLIMAFYSKRARLSSFHYTLHVFMLLVTPHDYSIWENRSQRTKENYVVSFWRIAARVEVRFVSQGISPFFVSERGCMITITQKFGWPPSERRMHTADFSFIFEVLTGCQPQCGTRRETCTKVLILPYDVYPDGFFWISALPLRMLLARYINSILTI